MRGFWRSRKALTPVLSNLLLTVIAVSAMSLAATATYVISNNLHDIMGERLVVEDVWFKPSGGVWVYVRNTGKVAVRIASVYVNFTAQPFSPLRLEVGEGGWLNVDLDWVPNGVYHVNIVTERGTKLADYYRAP